MPGAPISIPPGTRVVREQTCNVRPRSRADLCAGEWMSIWPMICFIVRSLKLGWREKRITGRGAPPCGGYEVDRYQQHQQQRRRQCRKEAQKKIIDAEPYEAAATAKVEAARGVGPHLAEDVLAQVLEALVTVLLERHEALRRVLQACANPSMPSRCNSKGVVLGEWRDGAKGSSCSAPSRGRVSAAWWPPSPHATHAGTPSTGSTT